MIPAEAVEAARKVAFERYGTKPDATYLRTILEAAAPYMLATAWEEGGRAAIEGEHAYGAEEKAKFTNPYKS